MPIHMQTNQVRQTMLISDLLREQPQTIRVFMRRGWACVGCPLAKFETLEQAARAYAEPVDGVLKEILRTAPAAHTEDGQSHP